MHSYNHVRHQYIFTNVTHYTQKECT